MGNGESKSVRRKRVSSTLSLTFKVKPGLKLALLSELKPILDLCVREPQFVAAILNENPNQHDELFLLEIWRGTPEDFARVQGPKPYRQAYLEHSKPLLESVNVEWLAPTHEWGTELLAR
jgi:quinol monooxygenase YgiN